MNSDPSDFPHQLLVRAIDETNNDGKNVIDRIYRISVHLTPLDFNPPCDLGPLHVKSLYEKITQ